MFERLGSLTYRFRYLIVALWVIGAVVSVRLAPSLAGQGSTDQTSFLPAGAPSVQARDALEHAFPGSTANTSASITFDRATGLTDADRAYIADFAAWTTSADAPPGLRDAVNGTESAASRPELKAMLRSADGQLEMLIVNLNVANAGDEAALVVKELRDHLAATSRAGLETHVTGAAAISSDYLDAIKTGTESTTAVTVILVLLVLLLIYRAPLAALVPLVTIGAAFVVSRGVLGFLASLGWQVSSLLDTFLVVMVFGVGTDYAIFLISRYREEVSGGGDWHDAARSTVKRIGAVITASAATVMVGMASMAFGEFKMISSTGPAIAVAILVTLIAGLTLAPSLLSIFGHYLFWPLHTRARPEGEPGGFFARLAAAVSRHPGVVTVALLIVLLIPATYLPQVKTNFDVLSEIPAASDSRVGYDTIAAHLGEDKLVQSTGLVDAGGGGDMLAPASLAKLRDLMASLRETAGVATATSLVTPDGDGLVPDGFRPSKQLGTIGDGFAGDSGKTRTDSASLLDPKVSDGLDTALAYVNGLALAYPDVAGGAELRAVTGGIVDAQDIVTRVRKQSVLSTQLRALASSITSPTAAAASGSGASGDTSTLMGDYLDELATAYPEVRSLPAYKDAVTAAASLEKKATVGAALDLAAAFDRLAVHFDGRPDATLSPKSLSGTAAALELKREAENTFGALPDQFTALAAVFAARPDDIYIPTTLTGEDGQKVKDAVDAFVSTDRTATRFYVTSSNDPYSGGAFGVVRKAQGVLNDAAPAFGPAASAFLGGPTAQFADVQDTLSSDFQRVGIITVIGILVVLMVLLRAIVAPLYLVATVLISYASAVGLSAWIFQEVLGQPGVSFYLPLMVFVLLVALGSDYNIFLMSRVREESEHRPIKDGIRIASGHTGSVITSAGLILAGTFGSMATAPLVVLFQVGVAVAIGVLIDTFLVRSILVPAITTLVGDRAWWPSGATFAGALRRTPPVSAEGAGVMTAAGRAEGGSAGVVPAAGSATAGAPRSRARLAVALALVVLVPVTVAGLLTWSPGGSNGSPGSLPAVVVNLDEGGTVTSADGTTEQLALGSDMATALTTGRTDGRFTWVASDAADATAGLADGRYAAVLTIPADFSRTVAAIRSDTTGRAPRAALHLVTDDSSGYAQGTVAREITAAIGTATARDVTASYVDGVLLAVSSAHGSLSTAAADASSVARSTKSLADDAAGTGAVASELVTGLRELAAGADQAVGGTGKLVSGTRQLADGSAKLASGARDLSAGTRTAADGATALARGAASLSGGLTALKKGTTGLPHQVDALAVGTAKLSNGVADYTGSVATLASNCTVMGGSPAICSALAALAANGAPLDAAASKVSAGTRELADGMPALADGIAKAATGGAGVSSGATRLASGMRTLAGGAATLASGARTSADGAQVLANGTAKSASGIDQLTGAVRKAVDGAALLEAETRGLAEGGTTLTDGADALAKRLQTSADVTGTYASETRTRMGDLAADPVAVEASRINAVAGTSGGLAPFLMAVAAWLGALGAFLVLPALRPGNDRRRWRAMLVALAGAAGVAVAGALLMALGMRFLVGVEAARLPEMLGFAVLAALAFTAIVQALVAPFASRGWLAALLFLVVQIAASGALLTAGAAGPLGALRPFLPLTHAIDAFRGAIYGVASSAAVDAAVLVAWLVVTVLVTLAVAAGAGADLSEEAEPSAA